MPGKRTRSQILRQSLAEFTESPEDKVGSLRNLNGIGKLFGFDIRQFLGAWRNLAWYLSQKRAFYDLHAASKDSTFATGRLYPCLTDRYDQGGVASGQYFHQDLLAAQLIYRAAPKRHVDVGSRVDGFVAHVAVFCEVEVFDIRPVETSAKNITFRQLDVMRETPELVSYTESLSCLHALEHFGLGRYGDPLDYDGHRKGFGNLAQMVNPGGKFYFSVPISVNQRYEFNSHRMFSIPYLLALFDEFGFDVESFHCVDDAGELQMSRDLSTPAARETFGLMDGCGIFELKKRAG